MASPLARARRLMDVPAGDVLGRSLALNLVGRGGGLAMSFVSSIALARVLGPADRGLLALMLSASTIALAVTAVGQPLSVTYYASRRDVDAGKILGNTLAQGALLAAVLIPLTYFFHGPLADAFG